MGVGISNDLTLIILQVRLMKDRETGENKGYAFVAFRTKDVAQQAIEEVHGKEFKVIMVLHKLLTSFVFEKSWLYSELPKALELLLPFLLVR